MIVHSIGLMRVAALNLPLEDFGISRVGCRPVRHRVHLI